MASMSALAELPSPTIAKASSPALSKPAELFSAKGADPALQCTWSGTLPSRVYSSDVKGYVVKLDPSSKGSSISCPKQVDNASPAHQSRNGVPGGSPDWRPTRKPTPTVHSLSHCYVCIQLALPPAVLREDSTAADIRSRRLPHSPPSSSSINPHFSVDVDILDSDSVRRRLACSTAFRAPSVNPLHAQIPLVPGTVVARSEVAASAAGSDPLAGWAWTALCFDLPSLCQRFFGRSYKRLVSVTVRPVAAIRCIVAYGPVARADGAAEFRSDMIPSSHDFPVGVPYSLAVLDAAAIDVLTSMAAATSTAGAPAASAAKRRTAGPVIGPISGPSPASTAVSSKSKPRVSSAVRMPAASPKAVAAPGVPKQPNSNGKHIAPASSAARSMTNVQAKTVQSGQPVGVKPVDGAGDSTNIAHFDLGDGDISATATTMTAAVWQPVGASPPPPTITATAASNPAPAESASVPAPDSQAAEVPASPHTTTRIPVHKRHFQSPMRAKGGAGVRRDAQDGHADGAAPQESASTSLSSPPSADVGSPVARRLPTAVPVPAPHPIVPSSSHVIAGGKSVFSVPESIILEQHSVASGRMLDGSVAGSSGYASIADGRRNGHAAELEQLQQYHSSAHVQQQQQPQLLPVSSFVSPATESLLESSPSSSASHSTDAQSYHRRPRQQHTPASSANSYHLGGETGADNEEMVHSGPRRALSFGSAGGNSGAGNNSSGGSSDVRRFHVGRVAGSMNESVVGATWLYTSNSLCISPDEGTGEGLHDDDNDDGDDRFVDYRHAYAEHDRDDALDQRHDNDDDDDFGGGDGGWISRAGSQYGGTSASGIPTAVAGADGAANLGFTDMRDAGPARRLDFSSPESSHRGYQHHSSEQFQVHQEIRRTSGTTSAQSSAFVQRPATSQRLYCGSRPVTPPRPSTGGGSDGVESVSPSEHGQVDFTPPSSRAPAPAPASFAVAGDGVSRALFNSPRARKNAAGNTSRPGVRMDRAGGSNVTPAAGVGSPIGIFPSAWGATSAPPPPGASAAAASAAPPSGPTARHASGHGHHQQYVHLHHESAAAVALREAQAAFDSMNSLAAGTNRHVSDVEVAPAPQPARGRSGPAGAISVRTPPRPGQQQQQQQQQQQRAPDSKPEPIYTPHLPESGKAASSQPSATLSSAIGIAPLPHFALASSSMTQGDPLASPPPAWLSAVYARHAALDTCLDTLLQQVVMGIPQERR